MESSHQVQWDGQFLERPFSFRLLILTAVSRLSSEREWTGKLRALLGTKESYQGNDSSVLSINQPFFISQVWAIVPDKTAGVAICCFSWSRREPLRPPTRREIVSLLVHGKLWQSLRPTECAFITRGSAQVLKKPDFESIWVRKPKN